MPGPSVLVRILGDLSGLAGSFKTAAATGSTAAKGLHDAFTPALAALNQTGVLGPFQDALLGVGATLETVKSHIHDLPLALAGAGAGVAAVGVGLSVMGSKDQQAHLQLQDAVAATGKSYDEYANQVDKAIKHQEKFGNSAVQTQDALRVLTQATGDPAKALLLLSTASDLAAAKHESLSSAATQMGLAYNGNTRIFKQFGIQVASTTKATSEAAKANNEVQKANAEMAKAQQHLGDVEGELAGKKKLTIGDEIRLRDAHAAVTKAAADQTKAHQDLTAAQAATAAASNANGKALDTLAGKLKGQAASAASTFTGHLKAIKAAAEDNIAQFGQKYGPALQGAGAAMAGLGTVMKIGQTAMNAAKDAALGTRIELMALSAWEKIAAAATWLFDAAVDANPIVLIAIAIAALIALFVLLIVHVKAVRDAFIDAGKWIVGVWNDIWNIGQLVFHWIEKNWPLLLGILTGPFGLAIWAIYHFRDQIVDAIMAVIHWLEKNWPIIVGILTGGISLAITWIVNHWNRIISFFQGAISTIGGIFTKIGHAIAAPFLAAFNAISTLWNDTVGKLSFKIPHWVPFGLGGKEFAMPHLPILSFQNGGLVPYTGLHLLHAGENVIPANQRSGPAIVISNAHFSSDIDIDLFMRRAAWAIQTQKV
jgi:hypothetical protein